MGSEITARPGSRVSESQVLAQITNAVIVVESETRVLFWNHGAELLYRRTADEMLGQPLALAFHYEWVDRQREEDVLHAIRQTGVWSGENVHLVHDGRRLFVESQVRLFHDEDGQPIGFVAVIHDVTAGRLRKDTALAERDRVQERLALAENRYRSLVHASTQIVWTCPPNGLQTGEDMSEWQKFTGQTSEEIVGLGWSNAIHPEDREVNVRLWNHSVATGTACEFEQRLRRYDGVYRNMLVRATPVRNSIGEIVEWVGMNTDITGRKAAEEAVRQSNSRFRRLFESDLVGIEISDTAGNTLDANNCFLDLVGYSRDDLEAGRIRWRDMTPVEYAPLDDAGLAEVAVRGSCTPYEKEYVRKDGIRVPILIGYAQLEGSQNQYVSLILNLSRQRQAEAELRRSERLYRSIGESINYGVWVSDAEGRNLYASDSFLKLVGLTQQQCSDFGWADVMHPDDAQHTIAHWEGCVSSGSAWDAELRFRGTDGKWHYILSRALPVRDDRGTITGWAGINLDITRIKEAESALREREQTFRVLAESLPQLVWVADAARGNTHCNQRMLAYTGEPLEALMGMGWVKIIHPDDLPATRDRWQHSLDTGEPFLVEYRLRRYDGEYRHFLARAIPLKNDSGDVEQWIGSSTDVHDQKIAEEALRRSERLVTAGRLAATLAHEINNPLEAVDNALYVALHDKGLEAPTRECLELASDELRRVIRLTAQTLGFQRQSTAPEMVNLGEVIESACSLFEHRIRNANIKVTIDAQTDQLLYCNRDDLRQVFANLIGNALDAMAPWGTIAIRTRLTDSWREPRERGLRVTLADSGTGITPAVRQHLFQPFFTTKELTGTGLGLWVSEGIVRKHGGHISMRTSTDPNRHGTVFSIFLPLDGAVLKNPANAVTPLL